MGIRKLVYRSFIPVIIVSLIMIVLTILSYYSGFKETDESLVKSFLQFFDLNLKFNGAMWISVFMWIITGLSFTIVGQDKKNATPLFRWEKVFLIVIGLFMGLLSIEKVFEFHLMIEFRAVNFLGLFSDSMRKDSPYYWLYYLLLPILIALVITLFNIYYKLFKGMIPNRRLRNLARNLFIIALLSFPLSILFDIIQGYFWYSGMKHTVFNSIESCWEVIGLTCFIGCNKYVKKFYSS